MKYEDSKEFALQCDHDDTLSEFREKFYFPKSKNDNPCLYFCGNSLGLQPKNVKQYVNEELDDWAQYAVEGHFHAKRPWYSYHENFTESLARIVGAKPIEVVIMNTLSVNLHLMMVSFYRPTKSKNKILIEYGAFPSDRYAMQSQISFHGYHPHEILLELKPRENEHTLCTEDILSTIDDIGDNVALILLGNVNFLTGQAFEVETIVKKAREKNIIIGLDLAHGAGNLLLSLHDWDVDFAVWCTYKYLNAGPGSLGGCFVHEKYANDNTLPRFAGWWGNNETSRFEFPQFFEPTAGAEGWQLSNPPILSLAALRASLDVFDKTDMKALREKSKKLTGYLEFLLQNLKAVHKDNMMQIITPSDPEQRGCQLSLKFKQARSVYEKLLARNIITDFRKPDILRISPTPLYNSFADVYEFVNTLRNI